MRTQSPLNRYRGTSFPVWPSQSSSLGSPASKCSRSLLNSTRTTNPALKDNGHGNLPRGWWLVGQKQEDLVLTGFFQVDTQVHAANLGMDFLEELPETRVEAHYATFRLYFGEDHIDFAQAVALEYYFLTINFGLLRAGLNLRPEDRTLFVAMDRFPGKSPDNAVPGQQLPATQGSKFLDFIRRRSSTGIHIEQENSTINMTTNLGILDWWKPRNELEWRNGKSHPHFTLPDWLAAALADAYPDEFAASSSFKKPEEGADAVAGLTELYKAFKLYDLWSATGVAPHLQPAERRWTVPTDAREFILACAAR